MYYACSYLINIIYAVNRLRTSHMHASMSLVTCFHDINLSAYNRYIICKYQHCLLQSMPVITYVINQSCIQCVLLIYDKCPPVMHLPSHARLIDQDGRHTPPTISAATCKIESVVQLLSGKCRCLQLLLEQCRCFQLLLKSVAVVNYGGQSVVNLNYFVITSSSASDSAHVTVPTVSTTRLRLQLSLRSGWQLQYHHNN